MKDIAQYNINTTEDSIISNDTTFRSLFQSSKDASTNSTDNLYLSEFLNYFDDDRLRWLWAELIVFVLACIICLLAFYHKKKKQDMIHPMSNKTKTTYTILVVIPNEKKSKL